MADPKVKPGANPVTPAVVASRDLTLAMSDDPTSVKTAANRCAECGVGTSGRTTYCLDCQIDMNRQGVVKRILRQVLLTADGQWFVAEYGWDEVHNIIHELKREARDAK